MSISKLSPSAIKLLSATQVITDPRSVIKELIDNALDAYATNISIETSTDFLDLIQVRDNGHGIPPLDRPLLCKRYHTSKISTLAEISCKGATSLGFRGEALASAANLSSAVIISTRVDKEPVAVRLTFASEGRLVGEVKASHCVGTTVRVQGFLSLLPVRKQMHLKTSLRGFRDILRLVQSYSLARPSVRFSFRVNGTRNNHERWLYSPVTQASLTTAALNIFGKDCTSCCSTVTHEHEGYALQAFLLAETPSHSKGQSHGCFISVDSRPVRPRQGILKQIYRSYRRALRDYLPATARIQEPLLCLSIVCPQGSYDVNIEPAKDDVLFIHSEIILTAVQNMFTKAYPKPADSRLKEISAIKSVQNVFDPLIKQSDHPLLLIDNEKQMAGPQMSNDLIVKPKKGMTNSTLPQILPVKSATSVCNSPTHQSKRAAKASLPVNPIIGTDIEGRHLQKAPQCSPSKQLNFMPVSRLVSTHSPASYNSNIPSSERTSQAISSQLTLDNYIETTSHKLRKTNDTYASISDHPAVYVSRPRFPQAMSPTPICSNISDKIGPTRDGRCSLDNDPCNDLDILEVNPFSTQPAQSTGLDLAQICLSGRAFGTRTAPLQRHKKINAVPDLHGKATSSRGFSDIPETLGSTQESTKTSDRDYGQGYVIRRLSLSPLPRQIHATITSDPTPEEQDHMSAMEETHSTQDSLESAQHWQDDLSGSGLKHGTSTTATNSEACRQMMLLLEEKYPPQDWRVFCHWANTTCP